MDFPLSSSANAHDPVTAGVEGMIDLGGYWVPAFAGMTGEAGLMHFTEKWNLVFGPQMRPLQETAAVGST